MDITPQITAAVTGRQTTTHFGSGIGDGQGNTSLSAADRTGTRDARSRCEQSRGAVQLGQWYAFRGADEWAVELLDKTRSAGDSVATLALADCQTPGAFNEGRGLAPRSCACQRFGRERQKLYPAPAWRRLTMRLKPQRAGR